MGKARTFKKLRREAGITAEADKMLEIRQRKKWLGEIDEKGQKIIRLVWGTIRHKEGTPRQMYKKLKTMLKGG